MSLLNLNAFLDALVKRIKKVRTYVSSCLLRNMVFTVYCIVFAVCKEKIEIWEGHSFVTAFICEICVEFLQMNHVYVYILS